MDASSATRWSAWAPTLRAIATMPPCILRYLNRGGTLDLTGVAVIAISYLELTGSPA